MTHSTRTTRTLIALTCALLCSLSLPSQAQGLKTNSGNFGSGWQVGGAGSDTGGGYGSAGSGSSSGSGSGSPGSGPSTYGGYSGNSNGTGTTGSTPGSYGGYSGAYGGTSAPPTSEAPSSANTPYSAPRSAGGGLRAQ